VASRFTQRARRLEKTAALAIYSALAFLFFALPLLAGFSECRIGYYTNGDPQQYIWGLAWYPYALSHGLDPIFTKLAWTPTGYNLAWSTTVPGLAVLMWPVTRLFGPLVSYNLLTVTAPVLGAFTTFLLCRCLAGTFWPALVGGYIFGFSPYELTQLPAHLMLAIIGLVPLAACLVCLFIGGHLSRLKFVVLLTAILVTQFLVSPEIATTGTLFGAVAILLARQFSGDSFKERLGPLLECLAWSYGAAGILLAGYLKDLIADSKYLPLYNPAHASTDLLDFFVPHQDNLIAHVPGVSAFSMRANWFSQAGAFVGLLPLVVLLFALTYSDRRTAKILIALMVTTSVAALGPVLHLAGHAVLPLPWLLVMPIPLINNSLPFRFPMYLFLVMGIATALWLAEPGCRHGKRWLLAGLMLIMLLPDLNRANYVVREDIPNFFRNRLYERWISQNETVVILPYGADGPCMLWQAAADFHFRMAEAYVLGGESIPPSFESWPIVEGLQAGLPYISDYKEQFRVFLAAHDVHAILVQEQSESAFQELLSSLDAGRTAVSGVVLYEVNPESLAPLASVTAEAMGSRYNLDRFALLAKAAQQWLARGLRADQLNPFAAVEMGMLPRAVAGYPWPAQASGYGIRVLLTRNAHAQAAVEWIMRHYHVRYRLAAELGPAPIAAATKTGVWLGPWSGGRIALGIVGNRDTISETAKRYRANADRVYYPYPLPYERTGREPAGENLLVMVFRPEVLLGIEFGGPSSHAASLRPWLHAPSR
jgi:hypothetical protein